MLTFFFFASDEHELAIAQDTGAGQGEIIVDLQMDNEAARRQKQQEAEEKRQQNMLPVWHQRSTVSDALTSTSEVVEEKKNEDEDEMFEEVAQEEFDADRHDCKYNVYTGTRLLRMLNICLRLCQVL